MSNFNIKQNGKTLRISKNEMQWVDGVGTAFESISEITRLMHENPDFFLGAEVQREEAPKSGKERQATYAENQRNKGRKQRSMWLTDDEALAVSALLKQMRG